MASVRHSWLLPMPAGPTSSVMQPGEMPPANKLSSTCSMSHAVEIEPLAVLVSMRSKLLWKGNVQGRSSWGLHLQMGWQLTGSGSCSFM